MRRVSIVRSGDYVLHDFRIRTSGCPYEKENVESAKVAGKKRGKENSGCSFVAGQPALLKKRIF